MRYNKLLFLIPLFMLLPSVVFGYVDFDKTQAVSFLKSVPNKVTLPRPLGAPPSQKNLTFSFSKSLNVFAKPITSISNAISYETDVFTESLIYISEKVQSVSDKNAESIVKATTNAADLSVRVLNKTDESLKPIATVDTADLSAKALALDTIKTQAKKLLQINIEPKETKPQNPETQNTNKPQTKPEPKIQNAEPKTVSSQEKENPTAYGLQPTAFNYAALTDLTLLKSQISDLQSSLSNLTSQIRNVPTVHQLPPTNTKGIGDITFNPKKIESESSTISGTTTTASLVVSGTAQIDGTTKLNSVIYTWPSADGSSSTFLQTNGSGTFSWQVVRQPTSDSLDFDELVNSLTLDSNLTITKNGYYIGIGQSPSTTFEVQGTASASYFLTGNTL